MTAYDGVLHFSIASLRDSHGFHCLMNVSPSQHCKGWGKEREDTSRFVAPVFVTVAHDRNVNIGGG